MTDAERKSEFVRKKYIPYVALTGELCGVFCEDTGEMSPHHNGFVLYQCGKYEKLWMINISRKQDFSIQNHMWGNGGNLPHIVV